MLLHFRLEPPILPWQNRGFFDRLEKADSFRVCLLFPGRVWIRLFVPGDSRYWCGRNLPACRGRRWGCLLSPTHNGNSTFAYNSGIPPCPFETNLHLPANPGYGYMPSHLTPLPHLLIVYRKPFWYIDRYANSVYDMNYQSKGGFPDERKRLNHKTCGIWGCGHSPSGWHRIA